MMDAATLAERVEEEEARAKALPFVPDLVVVSPAPIRVPRRAADVAEVLRCVAESYLLSPADIVGKDRHKNVAEARMVTCWLLRSLTKLSFPEIGRDLRKDHTTIMNGVKKIEQRRLEDPEFGVFTQQLREAVRARIGGTGPEKT